jgi:hypothetical protein
MLLRFLSMAALGIAGCAQSQAPQIAAPASTAVVEPAARVTETSAIPPNTMVAEAPAPLAKPVLEKKEKHVAIAETRKPGVVLKSGNWTVLRSKDTA